MGREFITTYPLPESLFWEKMKNSRSVISFDLEITARCNNNCRHCYINLPAQDKAAKEKELSLEKIKQITQQAADAGALWCLITGGEPLLREDFFDIYLSLKKIGLFVSVFTNAALITHTHIKFFKKYPPRDIEITVYGVTEAAYERITRQPGSFNAFMRGLNLLLENNIKVRFKAMALRSNAYEFAAITEFCKKRTKDYFRFDPLLHLRFDGNLERNKEIQSERLSAKEIAAIEKADAERFNALEKGCDKFINSAMAHKGCNHLFYCGTGRLSFTVSYDGLFRLCSSLWYPGTICDLKKISLRYALKNLVLKVRDMSSDRKEFLDNCNACPIINLCMWCPAHAYLETGELDKPVEYFCEVAHARAGNLRGEAVKQVI